MNESVKTHHDFVDYIDILSTRYANGEITREEFEKQSEDLFHMDAMKTYLETMAETSKLSEDKACASREDQTISGWFDRFYGEYGMFGKVAFLFLSSVCGVLLVITLCLS